MQSVVVVLSFFAARPDAGALQIAEEREIFERSKDGGDGPLGGGDVVDAACVAEDHVGGHELEEAIDASDGGLSDAESVKKREHLLGLMRPGGRDPEFDFDGVRGTEGNELERDAVGQKTVEVRIDDIGHAYFEHGTRLRFPGILSMLPRCGMVHGNRR
jgi:hypothetical protein